MFPPSTPIASLKRRHNLQSAAQTPFLTRNSNTPAAAWDTKGRIGDMEVLYAELKQQSHAFNQDHAKLEDKLNLYKTRGTPTRHQPPSLLIFTS